MSEDSTQRLRRKAEEVLNAGSFDRSDTGATLREVVHELYVHQAELEIQNEELRTAQQALEASRQEYLLLFQSLPLACFTVTAAGIVGEANGAAERQFGLPQRRLKGRPLALLVEPADHGRLFASLHRLRESGGWSAQEYRYVGARGPIEGMTDARTVAMEDGDKGDVLLTVTDVTERNAWTRDLQAAREEAERARNAYHHILQAVADGIVGFGVDHRVTFSNAAATALTGTPPAALVGRPVGDLLVMETRAELVEAIGRALRDGQPRRIDVVRMRRGGGSFPAELSVSPIREHGRPAGGVLAFRDIGARLEAAEAVRTSEERHRTLVHSLHEGLVLCSPDGRVLLANMVGRQVLAGPAAPLLDPAVQALNAALPSLGAVSTAVRRFVGPDGARLQGPSPVAEAVAVRLPVVDRVVGITDAGGGGTTWLRLSSHPVLDAAGRVETLVCSVSDITPVKALERQLHVALQAKERFIASASHDLRQPVQALLLLAGLVLKQDLPPDARRLSDQVRETTVSLSGMLEALLDISRLEAGLITPIPGRVALAPLMQRLGLEFEPLATAQGLRFATVPAGCLLETDAALLERILRNLLSNAVRYTRHGRILFGARRRGGLLRVEVWDTGIGIAEDQIDEIFEDYYQVGNAARNRSEGLGMGLAIARRLAAMLGGRLSVASRLGRGSCFTLTLPFTAPLAPPPAAENPPEESADADSVLVLVVEDDAVIRMALGLMLREWGYRVLDAGSVREALELVDGGALPALVLADYRLPGGETGLALLDRVRERLGSGLPAVLLTGDTSSDRLREAASADCALLHKPVDPAALRQTVRRCLLPR